MANATAAAIALRCPEPEIYTFEGIIKLRTWQDAEGQPIFSAADACEVAGHTDVSKAVSRLDPDEKGTISIRTLGGTQTGLVVTEAGFYNLIGSFRLRKDHPNHDALKRFKRWVNHDVLPSIRKSGSFSSAPAETDLVEIPSDPLEVELLKSRLLTSAIQATIENRKEIGELKEEVKALTSQTEAQFVEVRGDIRAQIDDMKAQLASATRAGTVKPGWKTIYLFCIENNIRLTQPQRQRFGRKLSIECQVEGFEPDNVEITLFNGTKVFPGIYPIKILERWKSRFIAADRSAAPQLFKFQ